MAAPDHGSYELLLVHVLACARGYMFWCCDKLGLPAPDIPAAPDPGAADARAEDYVELVCAGWRTQLRDVPPARFNETYASSWGVDYCIDALLEHAVMHPIRHRAQLERLA